MRVCNENHSAVVVFENNSCPLCAMLDAYGKPRDVAELGTTPNTGSPKLPGWEDVSNEIRRHRTYTHPGAELVDLGIAKIVYDFIARQLRADA